MTGDLQHHAIGCYSANSEIKRNNRRSENRLLAAEKWMTAASRLAGMAYDRQAVEHAWEDVLFNQFHDILGGCCLKEAYEDAREFHGEALKISSELMNHALQRISWKINTKRNRDFAVDRHFDWKTWENEIGGSPVVIFNPNAWESAVTVKLTQDITGALDENDAPVAFQRIRADKTCNSGKDDFVGVLQLQLPPMGYRTVYLYHHLPQVNPVSERMLQGNSALLENDWFRLRFDPASGALASVFDKRHRAAVHFAPHEIQTIRFAADGSVSFPLLCELPEEEEDILPGKKKLSDAGLKS